MQRCKYLSDLVKKQKQKADDEQRKEGEDAPSEGDAISDVNA